MAPSINITIQIDLGQVARDLGLPADGVQNTVALLDDGNTVPFITRYRKDHTGALDEEQIRLIQEKVGKLRALAERKQTILKSIQSQGKLTTELADHIRTANSSKRLEDLYLPFKPKKQTLATLARQRGLEPLAREVLNGDPGTENLSQRAETLIEAHHDLNTVDDVLTGVGHIVAEWFSERADVRGRLRKILHRTGKLICCRVDTPRGGTSTSEPSPGKDTGPATVEAEAPAPTVPSAPLGEELLTAGSSAEDATPPYEPITPDAADAPLAAGASTPVDPMQMAPDAPPTDTIPPTPSAVAAPSTEPVDTLPPPPGPISAATESPSAPDPSATEPPAVVPDAADGSTPSVERPVAITPSNDVVAGDGPLKDGDEEQQLAGEQAGETPPTSNTDQAQPAGGDVAEKLPPLPTVSQRKKPKKRGPLSGTMTKKEKKRQRLEAAFKDYFDFRESISRLPPHRVLAINRGERARILRAKIDGDVDAMTAEAERLLIPEGHIHADFLKKCVRDALCRLLISSLDRELRREMTERAEGHAVEVFARNLKKLLLQPPVYEHRVLAIDPGFRSGCKVIALDEFGNVLGHEIVHVIGKDDWIRKGRKKLVNLIRRHQLSVVAIGNGTACRETEQLVVEVMSDELKDQDIAFLIVNEAGASVYSTSPLGREELPKYDAVLRSAISIGRRLLDPLSELVKINPANIGVGMYQHDVKAKHLRSSLDAVVESCVNYVGVDVNAASSALLGYVSGLNQLTARRLCEYRAKHGPFENREQFKKVPGFGEATFVQAAGFLKITNGDTPFDATWIHPESYEVARKVLDKLGCSVGDLADAVRSAADRHSSQAVSGPDASSDQATADAGSPPVAVETASQPAMQHAPDSLEPDDLASAPSAADVPSSPADASPPAPTADVPGSPAEESAPAPSVDVSSSLAEESVPALSAADVAGSPAEEVAPAPSVDVPSSPAEASVRNSVAGDGAPVPTAADTASSPAERDVPTSVDGADPSDAGGGDQSDGAAVRIEPVRQADSLDPRPGSEDTCTLIEKVSQFDVDALSVELSVSKLVLPDILSALARPGRDPREDLPPPVFRRGIVKLEDLETGMKLSGTVLNVVDFGAFVDIGLSDSGLIHISRLADRYVRDPHEVVGVGDVMTVWVVEVDKERRRVSLTAIEPGTEKPPEARRGGGRQQSRKPPGKRHPKSTARADRSSRTKASGQAPRSKSRSKTQPPRKPKIVTPITKEMEDGKEPLRSFSDLMQFYQKKKTDENESQS